MTGTIEVAVCDGTVSAFMTGDFPEGTYVLSAIVADGELELGVAQRLDDGSLAGIAISARPVEV